MFAILPIQNIQRMIDEMSDRDHIFRVSYILGILISQKLTIKLL